MVFTEQEKKNFCRMIEEKVLNSNLTYIDAIVDSCESLDIQPGPWLKFLGLNLPIKEKLAVEFQTRNYLPKTKSKLPI